MRAWLHLATPTIVSLRVGKAKTWKNIGQTWFLNMKHGEEPTRLRLRGVTILLGVARMTTTVPHDKAKTGIVRP